MKRNQAKIEWLVSWMTDGLPNGFLYFFFSLFFFLRLLGDRPRKSRWTGVEHDHHHHRSSITLKSSFTHMTSCIRLSFFSFWFCQLFFLLLLLFENLCDLHIRSAYNLHNFSQLHHSHFYFFQSLRKKKKSPAVVAVVVDWSCCPGHFVTFGPHCLFDYSAALPKRKLLKKKNSAPKLSAAPSIRFFDGFIFLFSSPKKSSPKQKGEKIHRKINRWISWVCPASSWTGRSPQ